MKLEVHVSAGTLKQVYPFTISEWDAQVAEVADACDGRQPPTSTREWQQRAAEAKVRAGKVVPKSIMQKASWDIRMDGIPFCWKKGEEPMNGKDATQTIHAST